MSIVLLANQGFKFFNLENGTNRVISQGVAWQKGEWKSRIRGRGFVDGFYCARSILDARFLPAECGVWNTLAIVEVDDKDVTSGWSTLFSDKMRIVELYHVPISINELLSEDYLRETILRPENIVKAKEDLEIDTSVIFQAEMVESVEINPEPIVAIAGSGIIDSYEGEIIEAAETLKPINGAILYDVDLYSSFSLMFENKVTPRQAAEAVENFIGQWTIAIGNIIPKNLPDSYKG